jgi:hypothetical protein
MTRRLLYFTRPTNLSSTTLDLDPDPEDSEDSENNYP